MEVLPASAGMIRDVVICFTIARCAPCICGDDPYSRIVVLLLVLCSLHLRG